MQSTIRENWRIENPFRRKLVFFEGLDKTGKTLLCRRVRFEGLHTVNFYERGFVGRAVFAEFRREKDFPIDDWLLMEDILIGKGMYAVIWLRAKIETIVQRHFDAGEFLEFSIEELVEQEDLYAQHIRSLKEEKVPVLVLQTDALSEKDCVKEILKWTGII